jgi:hypothetical protein
MNPRQPPTGRTRPWPRLAAGLARWGAALTVVHLVDQVPHMGFEIDDNHDHWPELLATLARRRL